MDGAGPVQSFMRISLPLIRPALAVCTVEALVLSLNIFDQVYILNGIAPLGSSVMLQTYVTTFQNLNFGGGYALSLLITIATALLSVAALALFYRRPERPRDDHRRAGGQGRDPGGAGAGRAGY